MRKIMLGTSLLMLSAIYSLAAATILKNLANKELADRKKKRS